MYYKHTFHRFFTAVLGIKKTETPIFQGISVVLPKLYLGGGRDRSRNRLTNRNHIHLFNGKARTRPVSILKIRTGASEFCCYIIKYLPFYGRYLFYSFLAKWSRDNFTTSPERAISAIRFGNAISALKQSATNQTVLISAIAPTKTKTT